MKNYIVITLISVLMVYSSKSASNLKSPYLRINCVLSNFDLNENYPVELSIKISSDLLETNIIRRDNSQFSIDEAGKTSKGVKYTVVDSDNYELNSVTNNEITFLYKNKQKLHLDRETLEIYIFQSLKTSKGTAYQRAQTVYNCSQEVLNGI